MHAPTLQASRKTKKTAVGEIPVDWAVATFGDLVESSQYGLSIPSSRDGRIPILGMKNIDEGKLTLADLAWVNLANEELNSYRLKNGDLLFNRTNSLDLVGKTALFTEPVDFVCASYLVRFRLHQDRVDPRFVCYVFTTPHSQRIFRQLATKAVAQANINPTALQRMFRLPVPPLAEQKAIADILFHWDDAIRKQDALLAARKERKQGLMQQLLTGKMRFKEFKSEAWRTVRIGSQLEECDRYVEWSDDQAYRFASIRRRSGGLFDRGTFHGREVKTKGLKLLKAGDFLISKRQVVHGAWAMVTDSFEGFGVSDEYDVLVNRDRKTLDMQFFNYLSRTRRLWHMAYRSSNGVHIEKLIFNFNDFAKEKVRIPPSVEEQARIVSVLSACDREIELLQKQLAALKEQKRGLMQKLLTGEVRVKVPKEGK